MALATGSGVRPGAGGELAFEWNHTDLSQFVSAGAMDLAQGGGGGAWSVSNVAERGNCLLYTPAGGTGVTEIAMFSPSLIHPTERRDLVVEMELYDATFGSGYVGPFVLADADTPAHGFGHFGSGVLEWQLLLNNSVVEHDASTGIQCGRFARYFIRGRKPAGAAPEVSSFFEAWTTVATAAPRPRRSGSSVPIRGSLNNFGNNSTLGATWNALDCNRFGLVVGSNAGAAPPPSIRILDFKVYVVG